MKIPCPCCGYTTLPAPAGLYEICPVCYWEDDPLQREDSAYTAGANGISLNTARRNYTLFGACEKSLQPFVRAPLPQEVPGRGSR